MREVEEGGGDKGQWRRATTGAGAGRSMVPRAPRVCEVLFNWPPFVRGQWRSLHGGWPVFTWRCCGVYSTVKTSADRG